MNLKVIFLDSGNTRLKYRFQRQSGTFESLPDLQRFIVANEIKQVVYACVSSLEERLLSVLHSLSVVIFKAQVVNHFLNLKLAYEDISALGVDRWLSMIAALQTYNSRSLVVVNAGTALTIDCIDANRTHHGGSISPGFNLAAQSLSAETALLPKISQRNVLGLGRTTASCINYGIVKSMTSLIEVTLREFDESACLIIGGGNADFISDQMNLECIVESELVLTGLEIYYRQLVNNGATP